MEPHALLGQLADGTVTYGYILVLAASSSSLAAEKCVLTRTFPPVSLCSWRFDVLCLLIASSSLSHFSFLSFSPGASVSSVHCSEWATLFPSSMRASAPSFFTIVIIDTCSFHNCLANLIASAVERIADKVAMRERENGSSQAQVRIQYIDCPQFCNSPVLVVSVWVPPAAAAAMSISSRQLVSLHSDPSDILQQTASESEWVLAYVCVCVYANASTNLSNVCPQTSCPHLPFAVSLSVSFPSSLSRCWLSCLCDNASSRFLFALWSPLRLYFLCSAPMLSLYLWLAFSILLFFLLACRHICAIDLPCHYQ